MSPQKITPAAILLLGLLLGLSTAHADPSAPSEDVPAVEAEVSPPLSDDHVGPLCQTAPNCCGQECGPGQRCCAGTVCSQSGRCIPTECRDCGDRGCAVDYDACTASCGPISCCLEACSTDANCCSGTHCASLSDGTRQCIPDACSQCTSQGLRCQITGECGAVCETPDCCRADCTSDTDCCAGTVCRSTGGGNRSCLPPGCDDCEGMAPSCLISDTCEASCHAPPSCGDTCQTDADCGARTFCREFSSGTNRCVPDVFAQECAQCRGGCHFNIQECTVECPP